MLLPQCFSSDHDGLLYPGSVATDIDPFFRRRSWLFVCAQASSLDEYDLRYWVALLTTDDGRNSEDSNQDGSDDAWLGLSAFFL